MFDTRPALADMAGQIRACRTAEGLTLQQLAARSGVAASTIHKVESQQMVPTVSVLLKIAKGLGTRPEDLIRDRLFDETEENTDPSLSNSGATSGSASDTGDSVSAASVRRAGVWRIAVDRNQALPVVVLGDQQRAMVLVENGSLQLRTRDQQVEMQPGDCVEVASGERIESTPNPTGAPTQVTVIISPPGDAEQVLGSPTLLSKPVP